LAIHVIVSRARFCKATATRFSCPSVDSTIAANLAVSEIAAQTLETQWVTQLKISEIGHTWVLAGIPGSLKARHLVLTFLVCRVGDHPGFRHDAIPEGRCQHLG
jgi:hypothetical protein